MRDFRICTLKPSQRFSIYPLRASGLSRGWPGLVTVARKYERELPKSRIPTRSAGGIEGMVAGQITREVFLSKALSTHTGVLRRPKSSRRHNPGCVYLYWH